MSTGTAQADFRGVVSARIQAQRDALAQRWLHRLEARMPIDASAIFPSPDLLDHIPTLIDQIAQFLLTPEDEIAANTFVLAKARELGLLRHAQDASVHQLLREYELLRNVLHTFILEQSEGLEFVPAISDVLQFVRGVDQAIATLAQVTVDTFIERYTQTIAAQTERLERFNHLLGHELRQPLNVLHAASRLAQNADAANDASVRTHALSAIERNVVRLTELVERITQWSRTRMAHEPQTDPGTQTVSLTTIAAEVARQLRDMADARTVDVRIADDLPQLTVDVGQLELILTNLISNAIKYSDPAKSHRLVHVEPAAIESECGFRVRDNGLGMDDHQLRELFTPFYRAHADQDVQLANDGVGLGLTIVRGCIANMGGKVSVESGRGVGTTFTVTFPVSTAVALQTEPSHDN